MSVTVLSTRDKAVKKKQTKFPDLVEFAFWWGHKPQMKQKMAWKGSSNTAVSPGADGDARQEDREAALVRCAPGIWEGVMALGTAGHPGLSSWRGTILLLSTCIRTPEDPRLGM